MAINYPSNLNERLVEDVINDLIKDLQAGRDPLVRDVDDVIRSNGYDNDDADEFFQIAINCMAIAEESVYRQGYDIEKDSKAYGDALDQAFTVAIGTFVYRDKSLSRDLPQRDYDKFADLADVYRNDIERQVDTGGRGGRGGRDRDRGRDRGRSNSRDRDRDSRSSRDRDSRSSRDNRDGRESRNTRNGRTRSERRNGGNVATTERRSAPVTRVAERERERDSRSRNHPSDQDSRSSGRDVRGGPVKDQRSIEKVVLPIDGTSRVNTNPEMSQAGFVINPTTQTVRATPTVGNENYHEVVYMEPYDFHELGIKVVVKGNKSDILVPLIDFTKVPELVDAEAVKTCDTIELVKEECVVHDLMFNQPFLIYSVRTAMAASGNAKDRIVPAVSVSDHILPAVLRESFTKAPVPKSFDGYFVYLNGIRKYLADNNAEEGRGQLGYLYNSLNSLMGVNLNEYLRIVAGGGSVDDFIEDWEDVKEFLASDPDVKAFFDRDEAAFLNTNARLSIVVEKEEKDTFTIRVEARYLVMGTNEYFLGNTVLPSRRGMYCEVDASLVPEYYSACAKLMRLRNSRCGYAPIVMFDRNNIPVRLAAGRLEGSPIYMYVE